MIDSIEADVLVKFERDNIPPYYKEYYGNKRHNFFATIQQFPYLWRCYISLDEIWQREFEVMRDLRDPSLMFPLTVYMSGHAKMRVAFEVVQPVWQKRIPFCGMQLKRRLMVIDWLGIRTS